MYELPISVQIDGESFKIRDKGDFRMILHCFEILNADDLSDKEKVLATLLVFYECFDDIDDVFNSKQQKELTEEMFNFMNAYQEQPSKSQDARLIDWEKDSMLLVSAINNVAGKEIRAEKYVHWWTFLAYYMAIGECTLSNIVSIRYKIAHGEKLEKYEKKFKIDNPQYFNMDMRGAKQKNADNYIQALWNGGDT